MQARGPHIPELDGVRGIAVLAVLAFHFGGPIAAAWPYPWVHQVVGAGWAGVDMFFVLSGFLITSILLDTRGSAHFFRNFYARRVLRIFPIYILVVGAFFFVVLPIAHSHGKIVDIHSREQIWYWLFLENWRVGLGYNDGAELTHLWSVAVEEQFYLFWSVVVASFGGRNFVRITTAVLIAVALLRIALWHMGVSELLIARSTVTRLDPLIAGALLAASPRVRALASRFAPAVLLVGCGMLLLFPPAWRTPLYFTNAITFGCLVARASEGKFRWLRSRFLRSFGKYSYAIYMFHYLVLGLLLRLSGRFGPTTFAIVVIVVGTSLSYGLARLSWACLEHPALRLKRFFPNAHAA